MSSIANQVRIAAPPDQVYAALATQAGYRGWWNKVAEVADATGGEARLCFDKDGSIVNMHYRVDQLDPARAVRWTCIGHDMPSWIGTTLDWRLSEHDGATVVQFEHAGWQDGAPEPVAQGWQHFLASLKAYVETGTGQPW